MISFRRLITLIVLILGQNSFGFTLVESSENKGWNTRTLEFHLNPENCRADVRDLIESSMALWNSITTSRLRLKLGVDSEATPSQAVFFTAAENNIIVCDPAFGTTMAPTDPTTYANVIAGVGSPGFNSTFQIIRGVIILNAQPGATANFNDSSTTSARVILAHEMGHVLGLAHSSDPASLMYYQASKTNFALSEDDINGISFLYGRNELAGDEFLGGCGSLLSSKGHGPSAPQGIVNIFALLGLMLLPLFIATKKRSRRTGLTL